MFKLFQKLLLVIASLMIIDCQAASQISDDAGCASCISGGGNVCRAENYDRYSYCCDETEIGSRSCGGTTAFCTTMTLNPVINSFVCPYSSGYCGASSSSLIMHPETRNNLKIEISNRLYVDTETCYYVFSVDSSVLDSNFKYFWDIEFYRRDNVVAQLNNGTSLWTANDPITVSSTTGSRFQYEAENNKIYMAFTASVSSASSLDPGFGYTIKLRSFDTRPPEPVIVIIPAEEGSGGSGGTTTVVTPVVPTGPTTTIDNNVAEVGSEGSGTVTPVDNTGGTTVEQEDNSGIADDSIGSPNLIDESLEQVNETESEPEILEVIEYVTIYKPAPVTPEPEEEVVERKKQYGLTALTGIGAATILLYLCLNCCQKLRKKANDRRQILAQEQSHTIEVGGFEGVADIKKGGSKRPGLKVNDGYDASMDQASGEEEDEYSYEEVEVEVDASMGSMDLSGHPMNQSENQGLMEQTLKPPSTPGAGLNSQDVVEDFGLDVDITSHGQKTLQLSVVNNILLHDQISGKARKTKKIVKKKKVKVSKKKGGKGWDSNNMITESAQGKEDQSWNSTRKQAMVVDLTRASPALTKQKSNPNNRSNSKLSRPSALLEIPESKKYAGGQPMLSMGNEHAEDERTVSRAALSAQEIEEAVELVSPGLRSENINLGQPGQSLFKRNDNLRLSASNQVGFTAGLQQNKYGSAMNITMQNKPPGSQQSNMMGSNHMVQQQARSRMGTGEDVRVSGHQIVVETVGSKYDGGGDLL